MPNHHDDCDCTDCRADEDRFWREQGEGGDRQMPPHEDEELEIGFDVGDIDDADKEDDITW